MKSANPVISRRDFVVKGVAGAGLIVVAGPLAACGGGDNNEGGVTIGGLIPFTGVETHNGLSMKYGIELGAQEINAAGGLAGQNVSLKLEDDASDVNQAVQKAQQLITSDKVDLINGTLSSNVRAAVFDVCKKANEPFMNPTFYEGGLCAPYYFSTGAPPNITIDPLAKFALANVGKSYYFIGSDYVWGTGSIKAASAAVTSGGGEIVDDPTFVPFGTTDFSPQIRAIEAAKPDVVWPFVAGQDGITFLKQLGDAGVRKDVNIVADYIDELIVPALTPEIYTGIVNCSTYFMSIDSPQNKKFLNALRAKYGNDALISSFGMNMYNNMKLLEVAAQGLDSWDKAKVSTALSTAKFVGPAGTVQFEPATHYAAEDTYIAEIQPDASFKIVSTTTDVHPDALCTVS